MLKSREICCSADNPVGGGIVNDNKLYFDLKDVRLNKLDISEFKTITSNGNLTINWASYFI